MKDGDNIDNNDFDLNDNYNLNYHKTDINKTVQRDDYDNNAHNQLLTIEVLIPNAEGDSHIHGTILQQATNSMNQPLCRQHKDTMHHTRQYIVNISNGTERKIQHNFISFNNFSIADF